MIQLELLFVFAHLHLYNKYQNKISGGGNKLNSEIRTGNDPLLEVKTHIPIRGEKEFGRKRLIEWIERKPQRVVVFQAAAGFGKTTAMAELAQKNKGCCGWYQISETDNCPRNFLNGIRAAVKDAADDIPLQKFGQDDDGIADTCRQFLAEFFMRIRERKFYLCFDNFHLISNETVIWMIVWLIECRAKELRLVFTVDGSLPAFLSACLLLRQILTVHAERLIFSEQEVKLLLDGTERDDYTSEQISAIWQYTGGWPAGLAFLCSGMKAEQADLSHFNKTHLYQYIFHEVFQKFPNDIQMVLIQLSAFGEMDETVCNEALGRDDCGRLLEYLYREYHMVYRESSGRYRYYLLYADFLMQRLTPEMGEAVCYRAARYYARNDNLEQAIEFVQKSGRNGYRILADAIEKFAYTPAESIKKDTVKRCLSFLYKEKERLKESTLYCMGLLAQRDKDLRRAEELFAVSSEKAYRSGQFDFYEVCMFGRIACVKTDAGVSAARELAFEAEQRLAASKDSFFYKTTLCRLEFSLALEDFDDLNRFLNQRVPKQIEKLFILERMKRIAGWAVKLHKDGYAGRDTPAQARQTAGFSALFAAYGYYCTAMSLYTKGENGWESMAQISIRVEKEHVFASRMRLLLLLAQFRKQDCNATEKKEELAQKIRRQKAYFIQTGSQLPLLTETDAKLLAELLKSEQTESGQADLTVNCLGELRVTGRSGPVCWRTKKTRELFACLFSKGAGGLKKDMLLERLWPETEIKKTSVLLHTTVSYLRKALEQAGAPGILMVENQTYALDFGRIWSDVSVLMRWNGYAHKGDIPPNYDVLEAMELYRECYMYGEDYLWVVEQREYVEQVFLRTMRKLAMLKMRAGEFETAALLLEKAVQTDSYAISLRELLIECHLAGGNIGQAKRHYGALRRVCRRELCVEPDHEWRDYIINAQNRKKKGKGYCDC